MEGRIFFCVLWLALACGGCKEGGALADYSFSESDLGLSLRELKKRHDVEIELSPVGIDFISGPSDKQKEESVFYSAILESRYYEPNTSGVNQSSDFIGKFNYHKVLIEIVLVERRSIYEKD